MVSQIRILFLIGLIIVESIIIASFLFTRENMSHAILFSVVVFLSLLYAYNYGKHKIRDNKELKLPSDDSSNRASIIFLIVGIFLLLLSYFSVIMLYIIGLSLVVSCVYSLIFSRRQSESLKNMGKLSEKEKRKVLFQRFFFTFVFVFLIPLTIDISKIVFSINYIYYLTVGLIYIVSLRLFMLSLLLFTKSYAS